MANIEKRLIIDSNKLSSEFCFNSILQEAYTCGLLDESDLENIQLQCISLLADKCERYNMGESGSIRVETAESIMKSNLYTIGLYLKSLPNPDHAAAELKLEKISELYERGRKLVYNRFQEARHIYNLVQNNKLDTINHSYNSTLSEEGIGGFFKSYNIEYEAHDIPASIDYQLCNPVNDLVGIEFIQEYLENLYLENEFCMNFAAENIHHLLYGYDKGYADLLINIFEHVLTAALGCSLAERNIRELSISQEDVQNLYKKLLKYDNYTLMLNIHKAMKNIFEELNITNPSLQRYIEKSLPKIASSIENALKLNTLSKVFIIPANPNLEPKIRFESGVKMDDEEYRRLIEELLICRYSSDKLELIKQKVKSFDDLEDVLLDAKLEEEEFISLFNTLGDVEIAAMINRHPFESDIQAVDLSEAEQILRLYLRNYVNQLPSNRQEQIFQIVEHLIWD
ncbi:hypothetical protein BFT35_01675 [Thermoanaerobacterium thermosaccharolyticum]|uniref:DUF6179 domain-containing protein n=1 Tax=Thermoanaerobacterium thermosaccharolyticum TaxID=1517 RepID=UPI000C07C2CC|nr:DUF6179 domain-containing protein [Thermoanaerobacterium thermosaccharolyticum]PHO08198.1 hypothetical protein BFT35_01675 [Thermoanaerobacterium thermosaccharolyticum]